MTTSPSPSSSTEPRIRREYTRKPLYLNPLLADSRVIESADGIVSYSGIDDHCGNVFIKRSALEQIDGSRLFSPCCGLDLQTPLALFAPFVREFWFVDIMFGREEYLGPGEQEGLDGLDLSTPVVDCFPRMKAAFTHLGSELSGPLRANLQLITEQQVVFRNWTETKEYQDLDPATLTETYRHRYSRRHIRIVRRRGFGFTTLRRYIDSIGVFFYRGDSLGEGGSGDLWLAHVHLLELLDKLRNGGLIVTDGSNHGHGDRYYHDSRDNRDYRSLWTYHGRYGLIPDPLPDPFVDRLGNRFECVGYAGQRAFGPVLIWQVWKPDAKLPEIKSPATTSDTPRILPVVEPEWRRVMPEEDCCDCLVSSMDAEKVLREFLEMPLKSTDAVFKKFIDLGEKGTIHKNGNGDFQEFLFIPGTRSDRVVLVAHADTWWDSRWEKYTGEKYQAPKELCCKTQNGRLVYQNRYGTEHNRNGGLGADDRAGCAMLYLLRWTGHSILLTEGEEHRDSYDVALLPGNRELFETINSTHQFAIQLDRRNGKDFKTYTVGTDSFRNFIKNSTDYGEKTDPGQTDIVVLCERICGVNFSIGYHQEHHSDEYLDYAEWKNTLEMVRNLLSMELPRFER